MNLEKTLLKNLRTVAFLSIKNCESWHAPIMPILEMEDREEWKDLPPGKKREAMKPVEDLLSDAAIQEVMNNYPSPWSRKKFDEIRAQIPEWKASLNESVEA